MGTATSLCAARIELDVAPTRQMLTGLVCLPRRSPRARVHTGVPTGGLRVAAALKPAAEPAALVHERDDADALPPTKRVKNEGLSEADVPECNGPPWFLDRCERAYQ